MKSSLAKVESNGTALAKVETPIDARAMESVLAEGDLSKLTPPQRVALYMRTCESVGLNPITKPFEYLNLNGKLRLYATKNCSDQLRAIHNVSIRVDRTEILEDVMYTYVTATMPSGRSDSDVGAVPVGNLKGEARANAVMKSTTKAKRRVTLSICGLSLLDESELDTVRGAQRVEVDMSTGEIRDTISAPAPDDAHVTAVMEAQARDRIASDKLADEYGPMIDGCETAEALLSFCHHNGFSLRSMHTNAKSRMWTRIRKRAAAIVNPTGSKQADALSAVGVFETELKDEISAAPGMDTPEESEVA